MKLIESKTLGTAAASIEFTSIPQDGTDLVFLILSRTTGTGNTLNITFNGNTTGYTNRVLSGSGSSVVSFANSNRIAGYAGISLETANTFGSTNLYIPNYSGATNKSYSSEAVSENNATEAYQALFAGLWSNTAAITSVLFASISGNLVAGSTISLYKVTKGSDGIVTTS
jgi:hypothetical protein